LDEAGFKDGSPMLLRPLYKPNLKTPQEFKDVEKQVRQELS
jgi:hypothetical protein